MLCWKFFFSELNAKCVCRNGTCSEEARPKPWRNLGRENFDKSHGFPSIPGIQKYHTKGKQRGALVKGQARKLLWWLIPGRVVLESSVQNSIPQGFAGMEFAPKEQGPNLWGALVGQTLMKVRGFATNPGIQKYHIKGKRRGARKKGQARKLLWWPIPGCVVRKVLLRT